MAMLSKNFSPAQVLKISDLFKRIANHQHATKVNGHRDTYKTTLSSMHAWTLSADAQSTLSWRENVERFLMELAESFDQSAFRNLNQVRPVALWPEYYRRRNEAIREACFAFARQFDITEVTEWFKRPLSGKRADFIICDDLGDETLMPPGTYNMTFDRAEDRGDSTVLHWKILSSVSEPEHDQEVIAMFNNVKTANVQFANDVGTQRTYSYLTDDDSIGEGDIVIVEGNQTMNLVTVKSTSEAIDAKATKWVIQKVDLTAYKERQRKIARAKELKKILDDEGERQRKMIDYSKAFAGNEELLKLVDELKNLQG